MKNAKEATGMHIIQRQQDKSKDMTTEVWDSGRYVMVRVCKEIYIQVNSASALLIVNNDS